jgi:hypothetical protein
MKNILMVTFVLLEICIFSYSVYAQNPRSPVYGQVNIIMQRPNSNGMPWFISAIYFRTSGVSSWGDNYSYTILGRGNSTAITLVAGLYDLQIASGLYHHSEGFLDGYYSEQIVRNVLVRENYITEIIYGSNGSLQIMPHKRME